MLQRRSSFRALLFFFCLLLLIPVSVPLCFWVIPTCGGAWNAREVTCKDALIVSPDAREFLLLRTAYLPPPTGLSSSFPALVYSVWCSCVCAFVSVRVCVVVLTSEGLRLTVRMCYYVRKKLLWSATHSSSCRAARMRWSVSAQESGHLCELAERMDKAEGHTAKAQGTTGTCLAHAHCRTPNASKRCTS